MDATDLLDLLRSRRMELGWTQRDVAERLGTSQVSVCRWESGAADPQLATAVRWAAVLGLNLTASWARPSARVA